MPSVIVTGAAGGMGQAIASALGAAGFRVIGVDRSAGAGVEVTGDVRDEAVARQAFDLATDGEEAVFLVANAGVTMPGAPQTKAAWDETLDINLTAPFLWGSLYAEYVAVPEQAAFALPESIGPDEATALTNYQLAIILLHHAARGVDDAIGDFAIALAIELEIIAAAGPRDLRERCTIERGMNRRLRRGLVARVGRRLGDAAARRGADADDEHREAEVRQVHAPIVARLARERAERRAHARARVRNARAR